MKGEHCDVAILGDGPVGACCALALADSGLEVVLAGRGEAPPAFRPAFRPLALSSSSRLILERVGAWDGLTHTPIRHIRVSQAGRFGRAHIDAADTGTTDLGYVLEYAALANKLLDRVRQCGIRMTGPLTADDVDAKLVVHAEGAPDDGTAAREYDQQAVVALVECAEASDCTAFERFTAEGPLALLPLAGRYAVVWACSPGTAASLTSGAPDAFLAALQAAAGRQAGRFTTLHSIGRLPLALRQRASRVAHRAAYIGNAAQSLHPVAGQGLNLGLRDAWGLARCIRAQPGAAGSAQMLERYARTRRFDASATLRVTDLLATLYVRSNPLVGAVRGAAIVALDLAAPARRFFARRMSYGASASR